MKSLSTNLIFKVVVVAAFAISGSFVLMPSASAGVPENAAFGKYVSQASVYRTHCAKCHGNDGRSNTKEGRRTEASDLTDDSVKAMSTEKMTRIIKNGKADMPGFGKKLSAAQIAGLVSYVRGL